MTTPAELYLEHHPPTAVPGMRDELLAVHVDARAELLDQPFYSADRFWERFENYIRGPGFDLVTGRIAGLLIGYAFGSTLQQDSQWWAAVQDGVPGMTERPSGHTFVFREILVRKAHQHRGYAHQLHDELLAHRPEDRAVLGVRSDNPARLLYLRWGWVHIGYRQPFPDSPRLESMVLELKELR
jgi:ribosomal protein S18 acetylase RimI-like enzyme